MELFQELLFTIALSLLVSFLIAKLFSLASTCDVAEDKSVSVSVDDVTEKAVVHEPRLDKKSLFFETIGSSVICDDSEIDDNGLVSGDFGIEEKYTEQSVPDEVKGGFDLGELEEDKVSVGGRDGFEENLVSESSERAKFHDIETESKKLVEESPERVKFREIEIKLVKDGVSTAKSEEVRVLESDGNKGGECDRVRKIEIELVKDEVSVAKNEEFEVNNNADNEEEGGLFYNWERIERTELEKCFGAAMAFVGSKSNVNRISNLDNDAKMLMYGLHKAAIDGPCHEPQPMVLKVSARAKWNAWQRLGNMSPEVAMEQYVTLLSKSIPEWMGDDTGFLPQEGELSLSDAGASGDLPSNLHKKPATENERKREELKPCAENCGATRLRVQTP
ncbi:hypothetical protein F0562_013024 [Nyssa sinensis]|uniref:ACB domain-containing protein n=1 Tax=Nyssa sinensis TaxID=561372 RepID=A0A5J4ZV47_9ASTE|nr:hypothetical protein F0562_013024 [Nyssa sinensis]